MAKPSPIEYLFALSIGSLLSFTSLLSGAWIGRHFRDRLEASAGDDLSWYAYVALYSFLWLPHLLLLILISGSVIAKVKGARLYLWIGCSFSAVALLVQIYALAEPFVKDSFSL